MIAVSVNVSKGRGYLYNNRVSNGNDAMMCTPMGVEM